MALLLINTFLCLMEAQKKYKNQLLFHTFMNIIFLIFITFSTFYHIPLSGLQDRFSYLGLLVFLQFTIFGFLYFLSLNRLIFYLFFPILFLIGSISSFFVYTQDIVINEGVVRATLETKSDVVSDLISLPFIVYLVVLFVFIFFILKKYQSLENNFLKSPITIFATLSLIIFIVVSYKKPSIFSNRLPYNVYYGIKEYYKKPDLEFLKINNSVISKSDTLQVVLVIGESLRADHLPMNGYYRNTMPYLSTRKNVFSLKKVYTNKTYTAISVPQILTNQSIKDSVGHKFYSLIDVLNSAKINTYWIGNQTPEISYLPFIKFSKFRKLIDPYHSEFSFHKKLDDHMLKPFYKYFSKQEKQFITLHMMGSHWYYENRYSENFRKFKPTIHSKYVKANSNQEMINSYDNTILFLDYFLENIIRNIEKQNTNTLLIYLSDHGEALGENGNWLHAQESESIKNPAAIIWFSEKFYQNNKEKALKIASIENKKMTTDFLYHTVLGLFDVKGVAIDPKENIFKK